MVKKLFRGKVVYYSGSIRGAPEPDPEFPWKLVRYMIENGADVLSENVAARTPEERTQIMIRKMGAKTALVFNHPEPWYTVRQQDVDWVDHATHVIALVNGPSHGVGMEIERALLKPERGLDHTPILVLVRADLIDKLSWMIRGINASGFYLRTYTDLNSACQKISEFLLGTIGIPNPI